MKKIEIENVKSVRKLAFDFPGQGLFILTGRNGVGKTTLMAAIHRIGNSNAFRNNYITSPKGLENYDSFKKSQIKYIAGKKNIQTVTYSKSDSNWVPRPKSHASTLKLFGFTDVIFIKADSARVSPNAKELVDKRKKKLDMKLGNDISYVLGDEKYKELRKMRVTRGKSKEVYLLRLANKQYCSEKNFSLGELSVIKALERVHECRENSVILIDEAEMALHPMVQRRFVEYLRDEAKRKNFWIFLCTHSYTIINASRKEEIIYLQNTKDGVDVINPCYPSMVLQSLAFQSEFTPDKVFVVEDKMAAILLDVMIEKYKTTAGKRAYPVYKILPIGTANSVIDFAVGNAKNIFSAEITAFLDNDKEGEYEALCGKDAGELMKGDLEYIEKINMNKKFIRFLPITPEHGLVQMIYEDPSDISEKISEEIGISVDIENILRTLDVFAFGEGLPNKAESKPVFSRVLKSLSGQCTSNNETIIRLFFSIYIEKKYSSELMGYIGSVMK